MPELVGVRRNLWMTRDPKGFKRVNFPIDSLALYLPLWHPELTGSPIISKDLNAHSCTVLGAVKGAQGRTFDGSDDYIDCGSAAVLDNIVTISVVVWINPHNAGEGGLGRIIGKHWKVFYFRGANQLGLYQGRVTTVGIWNFPASSTPYNAWQQVALTYDSSLTTNDPVFYINGASVAVTEISTPVGAANDDSTSLLAVGADYVYDASFDGVIGDVWVYSKILTAAEILHAYNATKWRYS